VPCLRADGGSLGSQSGRRAERVSGNGLTRPSSAAQQRSNRNKIPGVKSRSQRQGKTTTLPRESQTWRANGRTEKSSPAVGAPGTRRNRSGRKREILRGKHGPGDQLAKTDERTNPKTRRLLQTPRRRESRTGRWKRV
jgi:hypothetical protein